MRCAFTFLAAWAVIGLFDVAPLFAQSVPRASAVAGDIASLRQRADANDVDAMYELALRQRTGRGVPQDLTKSVALLEAAAGKGNVVAMTELGTMYEDGAGGLARDYKSAGRWFKQAADAGDGAALLFLGDLSDAGKGVAKNAQAAKDYHAKAYQSALERADRDARSATLLSFMYSSGRGVGQSDEKALRWSQSAADKGYSPAMRQVGWAYANGRGVAKDADLAMQWFQSAVDHDNVAAMRCIAWMYQEGQGIPKDADAAVKWYEKAIAAGSSDAMCELAWLYSSGPEALRYNALERYESAAALRHPVGLYNLALCYIGGQYTPKDEAKGLRQLERAVWMGSSAAYGHLLYLSANSAEARRIVEKLQKEQSLVLDEREAQAYVERQKAWVAKMAQEQAAAKKAAEQQAALEAERAQSEARTDARAADSAPGRRKVCTNCDYRGTIQCWNYLNYGHNYTCSLCKGTGRMKCPACQGKKYLD